VTHGHPYENIADLLRRRSLDRKPWLKRLPPPSRPSGRRRAARLASPCLLDAIAPLLSGRAAPAA